MNNDMKNETIQQKLARLTAVERNSLYKQCDICKGDATIVVNSTFDENPIYDETENCPNCSTGKVANKEVIEERMFEYECLIVDINTRIKRLHELVAEVEEHRYWLRKRL
jgi:hypothetical protein